MTVSPKSQQLSGRVTREPFGEVNTTPNPDGTTTVRATLLLPPTAEGAQTGLALDASGSMRTEYTPQAHLPGGVNPITPVARKMCHFLASKVDADGGTTVIYWALGPRGDQIKVHGDMTAEQALALTFPGPDPLGSDTRLLPAVKYFADRFAAAPWGLYVILTDGQWADHAQVCEYTKQLARDVARGDRNPLKFVLVGVGSSVNQAQMASLDDLDAEADLWDHKHARDMRGAADVMAEVVAENVYVGETGEVRGPDGAVVTAYVGGVPARLSFICPAGWEYFTLVIDGRVYHQSLDEADGAPPNPPPGIPADQAVEDLPFAEPVEDDEAARLDLEIK